MKKPTFLLALFLCSVSITMAQFYKSILPSSAFTDSFARVVYDFKSNFYPIQGKQLTSQGIVDVYQSIASVPGAVHCIIQRYHSEEDSTASWQAIMYEGESFDDALKIYKNTYRMVKKATITHGQNIAASFKGELEIPNENVRFTATTLKLNTTDADYENFYAEVELITNYDGWEVHLNMHRKKDNKEKD